VVPVWLGAVAAVDSVPVVPVVLVALVVLLVLGCVLPAMLPAVLGAWVLVVPEVLPVPVTPPVVPAEDPMLLDCEEAPALAFTLSFSLTPLTPGTALARSLARFLSSLLGTVPSSSTFAFFTET